MFKKILIIIAILFFPVLTEAKLPEITSKTAALKIEEIMKVHVSQKELTTTIISRSIKKFIDALDPTKTYFLESDLGKWVESSEETHKEVLKQVKNHNFVAFEQIHLIMEQAIAKRKELQIEVDAVNPEELVKDVDIKKFKDLEFCKTKEELFQRLLDIRSLQYDATQKLSEEAKEKSFERIVKHREKYENEILEKDLETKKRLILSNVIKAFASSLDAHTAYFTPDEASQFMIDIQRRLFGIGAQLKDDFTGLTIVKIIEGGPAFRSGLLKEKDRIIAVDGEPIVGMDISDAVSLIRGEDGTAVTLTVIRDKQKGKGAEEEEREGEEGEEGEVERLEKEKSAKSLKETESLTITITRGEVVFKETRLTASHEPFGDGVIANLKLFSFYQDPDSSSADDIIEEFKKLQRDKKIKGVILDLRYNSGGMLSQAIAVTGLFISKGIVASINDGGNIQHLRDIDANTIWDGPLVVLVNKASASAAEIVAQTLQDYGRGIVIGDEYTYGKGSFQTFTLTASEINKVNPEGEYKVTRGVYYTVSGKSPQLVGVSSDIIVPSVISQVEIGEKFTEFPLENHQISENFEDDLSDIPFSQREKVKELYRFGLQKKIDRFTKNLEILKNNSQLRIESNKNYQSLIKELAKEEHDEDDLEEFGQNDLQLMESVNIIKDMIILEMSA